MATRTRRTGNIGNLLEYTIKDIDGKSVDELIDAGYRFTIVNDEGEDDMEVEIDYG